MTVSGELEVAKVGDGSNELAGLRNVSLGQPDSVQGCFELIEALRIFATPRARNRYPTLRKAPVGGFVEEVGVLPLFWRCSCDEVVENVEVALVRRHGSRTVLIKAAVDCFDTAEPPTV